MPTTPVQALPYPALSDPANGPVAFQNLATALEDYKTIVRCTSATRPGHVEGRVIYETDTDQIRVSDGANWQLFTSRKSPRGYVTTAYEAGPWSPGDQPVAPTPAITNAASDLRVFQVTAQWIGKANASGNSGHSVKLERSMDNFATWTWIAEQVLVVYPSTSTESHVANTWVDATAPAGSVRYRARIGGYGWNGNTAANFRINVFDVGGQ
jgi:hypothetical protein